VDTSSISVVGVRFLVMMYGPRTEWWGFRIWAFRSLIEELQTCSGDCSCSSNSELLLTISFSSCYFHPGFPLWKIWKCRRGMRACI
jgi:hypothetical protein